MNRLLVVLLLVCGLALPVSAERALRPEVSASLFGETFLHPGARIGADVTVLAGGRHALRVGTDLGLYRHPGFHTGVLLDVVAGYRLTFDGGFFLDGRIGAGYLRTYLDGDTFVRNSDGSFARAPLAGANAFAPVQSLALGHDFSRRGGPPLTVFAGLTAFEQMPFNSGWIFHLAGQLGVTWRFGAEGGGAP